MERYHAKKDRDYDTADDNSISGATDRSHATITPYFFQKVWNTTSPILESKKLKEQIMQEKYKISLDGLALTTSSLLSKNNSLTVAK